MANYYGMGRTNTFAVKDVAALKDALELHDFEVLDRETDGTGQRGQVSIFVNDPDGVGEWARWIETDDGEDDELFVPDMIAPHLRDGEVAVFQHVGHEKQRYLTGYAVAVHSDGRQISIALDDVIVQAKQQWGVEKISSVAY